MLSTQEGTADHPAQLLSEAQQAGPSLELFVVDLERAPAAPEWLIGQTASRLSHASHHGVPVAPGVVLTTAFTTPLATHPLPDQGYTIPDQGRPSDQPVSPIDLLTRVWHEVARGGVVGASVRPSPVAPSPTPPGAAGPDPSAEAAPTLVTRWDDLVRVVGTMAAPNTGAGPGAIVVQRAIHSAAWVIAARLGTSRRSHVALDFSQNGDGRRAARPPAATIINRRGRVVRRGLDLGAAAPSPSVLRDLAGFVGDVDRAFDRYCATTWAVTATGDLWLADIAPAEPIPSA